MKTSLLFSVAVLSTRLLAAQGIAKGYVVADSTKLPLPLAEVWIEELGKSTTTSETGFFRLEGIPLGVYTLRVRRIGFRSAAAQVRIEAPDSVTLQLSIPSWIPQLEPILVTAPPRSARDQEIEERHRLGGGRLVPYHKLREREDVGLEDVLREVGVRIVYGAFRRPYPVSPRIKRLTPGGAAGCPMQVYLNGVMVHEDLSQYPVRALGTVEVFKSDLAAPIQYSGLGRSCGVILLWTRDR